METKSIFKSLTFHGVGIFAVSSICSFIHNRTGVNVSDQVQPVQQAVTGIVNSLETMAPYIGQLAGSIVVMVGRFRKGDLHVFKPTPPTPPSGPVVSSPIAKAALAALSVSILTLGLTGCGTVIGGSTGPLPPSGTTVTGSTTSVGSKIGSAVVSFEENTFVDQTEGIASGWAAINYINPGNKAGTATDIYSFSSAALSVLNGTPPTEQSLEAAAANLKSGANTQLYGQTATLLATDLAAQIKSWQASGATPQQIVTSVSAYITGLQMTAAAYGGGASPPTTLYAPGWDTGDLAILSL